MWTEVGKLLLFHLLLTELHCAKGKVALCLEGGLQKKIKKIASSQNADRCRVTIASSPADGAPYLGTADSAHVRERDRG